MADGNKLNGPEIAIVAAGVVGLIASFLPWFDGFDTTYTTWDDELLFPTFTWLGLATAAMAILVLVATFSTARLPQSWGGFSWKQLHVALGALALILAVSFLIGGEEHGFGYWLSLLAAIAAFVGAVLLPERAPVANTPQSYPSPPPPPPPAPYGDDPTLS